MQKRRGLNLELLDESWLRCYRRIFVGGKYRDHELKGNIRDLENSHIQPDWLLIYLKENDVLTLTLVDTGSHADYSICNLMFVIIRLLSHIVLVKYSCLQIYKIKDARMAEMEEL